MLGSAAIAVFMDSRLAAAGLHFSPGEGSTSGRLPHQVVSSFSDAMSEAILLPAVVVLAGFAASMFFERPRHEGYARAQTPSAVASADA